jgi:hypothetical protein
MKLIEAARLQQVERLPQYTADLSVNLQVQGKAEGKCKLRDRSLSLLRRLPKLDQHAVH